MTDQDTQATEPARPERATEVATGNGRKDDRNDEIDASPAPDPTDTDSEEVPEAD